MRLLQDEMHAPVIAEQLRARGHDVVSVHEPAYRHLEGAADEELFAVAIDERRALVTENVPDYRRLEADALAHGEDHPLLVFTTDRQFPRGEPGTTGLLVKALDILLSSDLAPHGSLFLSRPPTS